MPPKPDINWYVERSRELGLKSPRCPFATNAKCPNFFETYRNLGRAVPGSYRSREFTEEVERYERHWKDSALRVPDQRCEVDLMFSDPDPSVPREELEDLPIVYRRMCPEVAHRWFHLFVEEIQVRVDITEKDARTVGLGNMRPSQIDDLLNLKTARPMHYAECPQYSVLLAAPVAAQPAPQSEPTTPAPSPTKRTAQASGLSKRDLQLRDYIGPEQFFKLSDDVMTKRYYRRGNVPPDVKQWATPNAFGLSLYRIRKACGYPMSEEVKKKN